MHLGPCVPRNLHYLGANKGRELKEIMQKLSGP